MNFSKEGSLLFNLKPIHKLSELEKKLKNYIILLSDSSNNNNFNCIMFKEQFELEIPDLLKQIIDEINISKILPNYFMQLKISPRDGWNGRGSKNRSFFK